MRAGGGTDDASSKQVDCRSRSFRLSGVGGGGEEVDSNRQQPVPATVDAVNQSVSGGRPSFGAADQRFMISFLC